MPLPINATSLICWEGKNIDLQHLQRKIVQNKKAILLIALLLLMVFGKGKGIFWLLGLMRYLVVPLIVVFAYIYIKKKLREPWKNVRPFPSRKEPTKTCRRRRQGYNYCLKTFSKTAKGIWNWRRTENYRKHWTNKRQVAWGLRGIRTWQNCFWLFCQGAVVIGSGLPKQLVMTA